MPMVEMISLTPEKSFALCHPEEVYLTRDGVLGGGELLLVDTQRRLVIGRHRTPVTTVSTASIARLTEEMTAAVDHCRFRMLFTVDGSGGRNGDDSDTMRLNEAVVKMSSSLECPVLRSAVVDHDPSTGRRDAAVLREVQRYQGKTDAGVVFGVFAGVERPGRGRVGDAVSSA